MLQNFNYYNFFLYVSDPNAYTLRRKTRKICRYYKVASEIACMIKTCHP